MGNKVGEEYRKILERGITWSVKKMCGIRDILFFLGHNTIVEMDAMDPQTNMIMTELHKRSYKPRFQEFLQRPEMKQRLAEMRNNLDAYEKSRKSQQEANKK